MTLCDSHCHVKCRPQITTTAEFIAAIDAFEPPTVFNIMSTNPWDLDYLSNVVEQDSHNHVVPFLGIHPWYSHLFSLLDTTKEEHYVLVLTDATPELLRVLPEPVPLLVHLRKIEKLIVQLKSSNRKFGIGEIGLDKLFRIPSSGFFGCPDHGARVTLTKSKVPMNHQLTVLISQLEIADKFKLPVSLHCVRAHGRLFEAILNRYTRITSVILHSYSASIEQAQQWIKDFKQQKRELLFSFSTFVNGKSEKIEHLRALITLLDDKQILLESDLPIDDFFLTGRQNEYRETMDRMKAHIREFKAWPVEFAETVLEKNSSNVHKYSEVTKV